MQNIENWNEFVTCLNGLYLVCLPHPTLWSSKMVVIGEDIVNLQIFHEIYSFASKQYSLDLFWIIWEIQSRHGVFCTGFLQRPMVWLTEIHILPSHDWILSFGQNHDALCVWHNCGNVNFLAFFQIMIYWYCILPRNPGNFSRTSQWIWILGRHFWNFSGSLESFQAPK